MHCVPLIFLIVNSFTSLSSVAFTNQLHCISWTCLAQGFLIMGKDNSHKLTQASLLSNQGSNSSGFKITLGQGIHPTPAGCCAAGCFPDKSQTAAQEWVILKKVGNVLSFMCWPQSRKPALFRVQITPSCCNTGCRHVRYHLMVTKGLLHQVSCYS